MTAPNPSPAIRRHVRDGWPCAFSDCSATHHTPKHRRPGWGALYPEPPQHPADYVPRHAALEVVPA